MTAELFLLGIAFPDATELTGDVLLFMLLAPLQFFNRYVGLKLSGERPRLIALYRHIFTIILLLWLIRLPIEQLAPIGSACHHLLRQRDRDWLTRFLPEMKRHSQLLFLLGIAFPDAASIAGS